MNEPVFALSIGSVVGGPTPANAEWRDAIKRLGQLVAVARSGNPSPLNVNVVFQVPGSVLSPDFHGVRTGKFSRAERLLMVQVALPERPPDDVDSDLRARLVSAVDEAERWARERGVADSLEAIRRILEAV